ncbi:hydroxyacylglutathione hydrolase [Mesobaculum littorinae]|uniref:Hydroxyacylglutathione hydrolase n=1 Tax=Mesobaculum littorinae TaxID=2486419 RepID=A0A438AE56_9RHOB|nr:hydroxyacylglutathione hydrolase [Mesobaculum littorinae]RVV96957.1 hydroxyacylglutathione hydrolase [Mesobaculum littorinae]
MPLEILTVPCLADNYAFLLHDPASGETALVDAPEAGPILKVLDDRGWRLNHVLFTHHHDDHVAGLPELQTHQPDLRTIGAAADANRLPPLDLAVTEDEPFEMMNHEVRVLDVPGHTVGHIAYWIPQGEAVFTADTLMALGCGRLFEGSAEMMWHSLCKIAALPDRTVVYSGHEYTQANARFAQTIEPDNVALQNRIAGIEASRAAGKPTVPSTLAEEKETNPFLRAHLNPVKAALSMEGDDDAAVFAEIRQRKDAF